VFQKSFFLFLRSQVERRKLDLRRSGMPENKTLTFPPKSEWPTLTDADWASNRRHAFLKFKRLLLSMFTTLDFVVGNDNYGGAWALIYDTAARKAHKTYPPPTSAPRRRVHRQTQIFLHRILLVIFSDHCPAIISDYLETSTYDDQEETQESSDHDDQEEAQALTVTMT
jgi:hypothetical protein